MAVSPPHCDFNWQAVDFQLKATDGKFYTLDELKGENGTVILFMCNHCPYVIAVLERLKREAKALQEIGVSVIGINANDPIAYPADSFDNMFKLANDYALPFPYLHDETQDIARAYGAECTPDFFGFNSALQLQYRGRLDSAGKSETVGATRELFEAMQHIAETGKGPREQTPSMGCSIKWRN